MDANEKNFVAIIIHRLYFDTLSSQIALASHVDCVMTFSFVLASLIAMLPTSLKSCCGSSAADQRRSGFLAESRWRCGEIAKVRGLHTCVRYLIALNRCPCFANFCRSVAEV